MTDSKTATERLRELLDARGVEYGTVGNRCVEFGNVQVIEYADTGGLSVLLRELTPEQAVAATLGSGECEMEYGGDVTEDTKRVLGVYFCSECGSPNYNDCMPYFCIYCGKAVKR